MSRCPVCRQEMPEGARSCPWCGAQAPEPRRRRAGPPPPAPMTRPDFGAEEQPPAAPQPRRRRADAYREETQPAPDGYAEPYAGSPQPAAQQPLVWRETNARKSPWTSDERASEVWRRPEKPEAMDRAYRGEDGRPEQEPEEAPKKKVPAALKAVLVLVILAALAGAGMAILTQVRIARDHELKVAAYRELVDTHPCDEDRYRDLYEHWAEVYNLQPAYVAAIIRNESTFRPRAVSSKGARGLMQLMENTAEWINGYINIENYTFNSVYDPDTNIRFGCWYLNYLSRMFQGDPVLVTAAYHAGQGSVTSWLYNPQVSADGVTMAVSDIPTSDTRTYVQRVMRDYAIYDALYYRVYNDAGSAIFDPDAPAPAVVFAGSGAGDGAAAGGAGE